MIDNFKKIIKNKKFVLLMIAGFLSSLGNRAGFTSLMVVFMDDSSVLGIGMYTVLGILPEIIIGPFIAANVDRNRKIPIMLVCDILRIGIISILIFFRPLIIIYLLTALQSLIDSAFFSARFSFQRSIIKDDEVISAQSVFGLSRNLVNILGPIVGGLVVGFWGLQIGLVVNAITFLLSFVVLYPLLKGEPKKNKVERNSIGIIKTITESFANSLSDIKQGFKIIATNQAVLMIAVIYVLAILIGDGIAPLIFPIGKELFNAKVQNSSLFLTMLGLGSFATMFFYLKVNKVNILLLFTFMMIDGLSQFSLSFASNYYLGLFLFFLMGLPMAALSISLNSIVQLKIPKENLAVVNSLIALVSAPASIISTTISSVIANQIGSFRFVRYSATIEVILSVIFLLVFILLFKKKKLQYEYCSKT